MEVISQLQPALRLVTVNQLLLREEYQWLTRSSIRHLIFNTHERSNSKGEMIPGNGFDRVVVRVGRKVLIDLDEMVLWLKQQRNEPARSIPPEEVED